MLCGTRQLPSRPTREGSCVVFLGEGGGGGGGVKGPALSQCVPVQECTILEKVVTCFARLNCLEGSNPPTLQEVAVRQCIQPDFTCS